MLSDMEANSLIRGLIMTVQKSRSDLSEGLGGDAVGKALLKDLQPNLFGDNPILPRLLEWQDRCKRTGVIAGSDMFNIVKFMDMQQDTRLCLGMLGIYGYTSVPLDGPPFEWFAQTWPYLTDGL